MRRIISLTLISLLSGCISDQGLTAIIDESVYAGDGSGAAAGLAQETFNRACGTLARDDAQSISTAQAGEALIAEVYTRPSSCEDGNNSEDCIYQQDGTLSGASNFSLTTEVPYPSEFYYEYVEVGGSVHASTLLGEFGFEAGMNATSRLKITGTHLSETDLLIDRAVESSAMEYLTQYGTASTEMGYIDHVAIDRWTAEEYTYIGEEAAAKDPSNAVNVNGEYYRETGSLQTIYWVELCLEPIH